MRAHEVTVTEFTDRPGNTSTQTPPRTIGSIVVQPPISVGEGFKDAVLGRDGHNVGIRHVVSTPEATVFIAQSGRGDAEARRDDIRTIAGRIGQLIYTPELVLDLVNANPFPEPAEY